MKTNLIGMAVTAVALTSCAALANDWDDDKAPCDTHPSDSVLSPQPAGHSAGRYELRPTKRWVPARYEQVTVQQCREKRRGDHGHHGGWNHHSRRCYPVTETRLVPGYFEEVQQWVWVATYPERPQYSQYPGQRPPLHGQGRFGVRVSIR